MDTLCLPEDLARFTFGKNAKKYPELKGRERSLNAWCNFQLWHLYGSTKEIFLKYRKR